MMVHTTLIFLSGIGFGCFLTVIRSVAIFLLAKGSVETQVYPISPWFGAKKYLTDMSG